MTVLKEASNSAAAKKVDKRQKAEALRNASLGKERKEGRKDGRQAGVQGKAASAQISI